MIDRYTNFVAGHFEKKSTRFQIATSHPIIRVNTYLLPPKVCDQSAHAFDLFTFWG